MPTVNIVCWQEAGAWIGYIQEYPDYWTQGDDLEDLKAHLQDLYRDPTGGKLHAIRRVEELMVC